MRANTSAVNSWSLRLHELVDRLLGYGTVGEFAAWKLSRFNRWLTGVEIEPGAKIGRGTRIYHGQGTVIGRGAVIGPDCTILHQVTLGIGDAGQGDYPTLGRGVKVYAGAKLVGGITVGDGAVIGANALVRKDVGAGTAVVTPQALELQ